MISSMRPAAFPLRRQSALIRFVVPACLLTICFLYLSGPAVVVLSPVADDTSAAAAAAAAAPLPTCRPTRQAGHVPDWSNDLQRPIDDEKPADVPPHTVPGKHPIDDLIDGADKTFNTLLAKQSHNVAEAAAAYRKRRGPPPAAGLR